MCIPGDDSECGSVPFPFPLPFPPCCGVSALAGCDASGESLSLLGGGASDGGWVLLGSCEASYAALRSDRGTDCCFCLWRWLAKAAAAPQMSTATTTSTTIHQLLEPPSSSATGASSAAPSFADGALVPVGGVVPVPVDRVVPAA